MEPWSLGKKKKDSSIVLPFSSLQKIWIRCQVSRQRNICGLVIPQAVHSWGSKMGPSRHQSSFNTNSMIWWYPQFGKPHGWLGDCFVVILQSDFHPITLEEKWMKCQKLALQIPSVKSRNAIYSLYLISMYAISTSNRSLFDLLSPTYGCSNLFFAGGKSGCRSNSSVFFAWQRFLVGSTWLHAISPMFHMLSYLSTSKSGSVDIFSMWQWSAKHSVPEKCPTVCALTCTLHMASFWPNWSSCFRRVQFQAFSFFA